MKINIYHGPDRVPLNLSDNGSILSNVYQPFHGIISRGLLNKVKLQENISISLWNNKAHLLEQGFQGTNVSDKDLQVLIDWVRECKVLSFAQSTQAAQNYLEEYHSGYFQISDEVEYDLWNIKEGHTSSVWKVSFEINGKKNSFALNIARDYKAGLELLETSMKMKNIGLEFPNINMAKVKDLRHVPFDFDGETTNIVVVQNDWIKNAHEIHLISDKETNQKKYVLVEQFLTNSENPAQIGKIRGRYFNQDEVVQIEKDLDSFLTKAAATKNTINININDGDVVWDGNCAIVVAISSKNKTSCLDPIMEP